MNIKLLELNYLRKKKCGFKKFAIPVVMWSQLSITNNKSHYNYFLVCNGVQVISMNVQPRIKVGENVTLSCFFDLEKESLYSLNWWKDNEQFYQFSPNSKQQQIVYETHGVSVDVSFFYNTLK